eukprot:339556-Rhodomonas_salina.1
MVKSVHGLGRGEHHATAVVMVEGNQAQTKTVSVDGTGVWFAGKFGRCSREWRRRWVEKEGGEGEALRTQCACGVHTLEPHAHM